MHPDRWEHGSDFHYMRETGRAELPWTDARLFGSGRDALRVLLAWGRAKGWRRLFCPTFFCPSVVTSIVSTGIEVVPYSDSPDVETPPIADLPAGPGDAILVVNLYGLRAPLSASSAPRGAIVIEDHTHDPVSEWAFTSDASYAIASLRKTLPLPDGGALWSPRREPLPEELPLTAEHARAALDRLTGMLLKERYLEGGPVEKSAYRALQVAGEEAIGMGAPSGMTPLARELLHAFPLRAWRERRRESFASFAADLGSQGGARLLMPRPGAVPLAATLELASRGERDSVKARLVAERIYPAVLWPLDPPQAFSVPPAHTALAGRLLTLHTDPRYRTADMLRVSGALRRILSEAKGVTS